MTLKVIPLHRLIATPRAQLEMDFSTALGWLRSLIDHAASTEERYLIESLLEKYEVDAEGRDS